MSLDSWERFGHCEEKNEDFFHKFTDSLLKLPIVAIFVENWAVVLAEVIVHMTDVFTIKPYSSAV